MAELRSSANEWLEWEVNPEVVPKRDTRVWLIIQPAKLKGGAPPPPRLRDRKADKP